LEVWNSFFAYSRSSSTYNPWRSIIPSVRPSASTTKQLNTHKLGILMPLATIPWRKMTLAASLFRCSAARLCLSASRLCATSALQSRFLRGVLGPLICFLLLPLHMSSLFPQIISGVIIRQHDGDIWQDNQRRQRSIAVYGFTSTRCGSLVGTSGPQAAVRQRKRTKCGNKPAGNSGNVKARTARGAKCELTRGHCPLCGGEMEFWV